MAKRRAIFPLRLRVFGNLAPFAARLATTAGTNACRIFIRSSFSVTGIRSTYKTPCDPTVALHKQVVSRAFIADHRVYTVQPVYRISYLNSTMSLGQRLQKAPEKGNSAEQTSQDYEATIRRLKLLSKSQTALLKAFLHGKLAEGEQLVLKSIDLANSSARNKDQQIEEVRRALQALKLKDLEVDVASTKLQLQQELSTLRNAVDNGGVTIAPPPPAAANAVVVTAGPATSLEKDLERIKALEAENKQCRDQMKDFQTRLTAANDAITKANGNAAESAKMEIQSLKAEVEELKKAGAAKTAQLSEKDALIAEHVKKLDAMAKENQSKSAADSNKEQALRAEVDKAKAAVAQLEAKLAASTREWDAKLAGKAQELAALGESKARELQELEARLEGEKEEMMEAMAQEIEEVETAKAAEFEAVTKQLETSKQRCAALQNSTQGIAAQLAKLQGAARALAKDYKAHRAQSRSQVAEMGQSIMTQYKPILVGKLKDLGEELAMATTRYRKEMLERKKLHNIIQELKGNIRVYMRCRPPTRKEIEQFGNDAQCVAFTNPGEVKVFNEKNREKVWEFDEVFDTSTRQEDVYADVAALVTSVMDGYNVCIFAYGQTGSGKTWTMSGPADNRGVNTRALEDLFNKADARRAEWNDTITVSLLEVYNEEIRDLLSDGKSEEKLEVKIGPNGNHVPGLVSMPVNNIEAVLSLIAMADRNRSSATTNMNEHSSRSHMILTATVISEYIPTGAVSRGKLNLVDLAGSERINKSGATGQALKEAQNINKSLSALGDVIAARAAKQAHVPFRNSTLTYLLQDSISQDSKTLMIVCISPVLYNSEETFCSLNFAARVRTVELGKATKNVGGPGTASGNSSSNPSPLPPGAQPGAALRKETSRRAV